MPSLPVQQKILDIYHTKLGEAEDNIKDALIGKITPKERFSKDFEKLECRNNQNFKETLYF